MKRFGDLSGLAFEHAPDATLVLSNRMVLRANRRVEGVFGWSAGELLGQSIRRLYPGQVDFDIIGDRAAIAMMQLDVYRDQRFMRRKDGQIVWMEGCGVALDRSDPINLAIWTYRPLEMQGVSDATVLTNSERRVAHYLVNGFTSKEIAHTLGCSPRTVEVHRSNMIRKMKARNSLDLIGRLLASGEDQPS